MAKKSTQTVNPTATVKSAQPADAVLDALDGTNPGATVAGPVSHPDGTQYIDLGALRVHPDNPRNHTDNIAGVAVNSSVKADAMAIEIQRIGDIVKPLTIAGKGCKSKPGTILSGNRRFSGCQLLKAQGMLPAPLATRGVPVRILDNLTAQDESNILNDHGDTEPLNPTECFRSMLAMQANGYGPEDIVYRQPGLLAGFMQKTLPALPVNPKERAAWYDGVRDTLAYNVLCWGLFPASLLPAKILWIQEEKERAFAGKDVAKPVYNPFKPTASRGKQLYKAMRADKTAGQWNPETAGPEFNKLVEKFRQEDNPTAPTTPATETAEQTATPLTTESIQKLRDTVGASVPVADALLTFVQTGNRPDNLTSALDSVRFASALLAVCKSNPVIRAGLPATVLTAIDTESVNGLTDAVSKL